MEEALYETTILRQFAGLGLERIPDETTILNFRRLLQHLELGWRPGAMINNLGERSLSLRQGTIVDATSWTGLRCSRCRIRGWRGDINLANK